MRVDRNEIVVSFGYWVRRQRKALDLTQAALAWRVGCAPVTIKKIERDERRPSRQMAERLADHLDIPDGERDYFIRKARGEYVAVTISPATTIEVAVFRHNLPSQPTPFIGREKELADITRRLIDPTCRLLTLIGPGGIGKTRLALQAAQDLVNIQSAGAIFAHGIFFIPLTPINSLGGLISAIAKAVDFNFFSDISPRQQLLDHLREKAMLLMLDNFEHLLFPSQGEIRDEMPSTESNGAEKFVAEILRIAPGVKILVSSREALNLHEAWFHPVNGMHFPSEGVVEDQDLDEYDAIQLFVQSARRVRIGFSLATERQSVVRICQLVEGNPLAIEMAAAWLKMLPCDRIASEIERNLGFLTARYANIPERHRSMRAVFEHSWQLLAEAERGVFKKLSVFQGGFRQDAAEYVAGANLRQLLTLVSKSLIRRNREGRYEIHELLRQYAAHKLDQAPADKEEVRDLHCEFYADFLHQREAELQGGQQREALSEIDNLRTAWRWAITHDRYSAIKNSSYGLGWIYHIQGWFQEYEASFMQAAEALRTDEPAGDKGIAYGQVLGYLGFILSIGGEKKKGLEYIYKSQTILRKLGALRELAVSNIHVTLVDDTLSTTDMKQLLEEMVDISKEIGTPWIEANAQFRLGHAARNQGANKEAEHYYREALRVNRDMNSHRGIAQSLEGLGNIAYQKGDYPEARRFYQESLSPARAAGYQLKIGDLNRSLGDVALLMGEYEKAKAHHQEALDIRRGHGLQPLIINSIYDLGNVAFFMGEYENAKERYLEALARLQSLDNQIFVGFVFGSLGNVAVVMDDYQEARGKYHAALKIGLEVECERLCLHVLAGLAALLEATGEAERAVELAALAVSHPQCDPIPREGAKKHLDELEDKLPPQVFAATQERGMAVDLEATAREYLAELEKNARW